jgi:hypothetical protein
MQLLGRSLQRQTSAHSGLCTINEHGIKCEGKTIKYHAAPEGTAKSKTGTGCASAKTATILTLRKHLWRADEIDQGSGGFAIPAIHRLASESNTTCEPRLPFNQDQSNRLRNNSVIAALLVSHHRSGAASPYQNAVPNPSLKLSPNGRPSGPRGRVVYHRPHGPAVPPSVPA